MQLRRRLRTTAVTAAWPGLAERGCLNRRLTARPWKVGCEAKTKNSQSQASFFRSGTHDANRTAKPDQAQRATGSSTAFINIIYYNYRELQSEIVQVIGRSLNVKSPTMWYTIASYKISMRKQFSGQRTSRKTKRRGSSIQ